MHNRGRKTKDVNLGRDLKNCIPIDVLENNKKAFALILAVSGK